MMKRFKRRAPLGGVAAGVAALAVVGLASFGAGISPASNSASAKQYEPKKVTICHRTGSKKNPWRTIRVSQNALKAHLKHGDVVGACQNAVFTMCAKAKNGKSKTVKVKGSKKAQRLLRSGGKLGACKAKGKPDKGKEKSKPAKPEKGKGKGKKKGK